jgi:hypothetical protein
MSAPVDAAAVSELVTRERQCRDRGWWEQWASCFADDSVVDISWLTDSGAEFVRRTRVQSTGGVPTGRHRLSPPAARVNGDRACVELPLAIELRITVGDVEADLISYCRSQYRVERIGGAWRIARLTAIYERDYLAPAIPGTILELDPADFARYRPSYRCLAWHAAQLGSTMRSDLLGDDQPEAVARQHRDETAWLNDIAGTTAARPPMAAT